ncbi:MAG: hypothetical protein IBX57_00215 [Gammaproteobacteria bacterium]|nr:hypothetical protein [Gammaproteobacteria bacterium]
MANELRPEFLSINSLNPWTQHDSSPRGYMFSASHIAQALVIDGATPRRCQTGTEREFGKYTFNIKFPYDSQIIKVIPKYRHTLGNDNIKDNPATLIIYERVDTKEVGIVEMIRHSTAVDVKHQHFGFRYKYKSIAETISEGMVVHGGTIIADSPSIDDAGNYNYGVESNVAFMSVPGIIEDGVVVSESYLKKISSKGFEKRVTSWGKEYYPLNLYGDVNNYKPFPDIGDRIRDDGLLFALRSYDDLLGPVEMNKASLQSPDYVFDKLVYAKPGAKVVDVAVHHDTINRNPPTPVGMEVQVDKYHQAMVRYYTTILETYNELHRVRKDSLVVTPEFHRLVVEAVGYIGLDGNPLTKHLKSKDVVKRRVQKLHRRKEIDDWRVEVTFEYDVSPVDGFKITDAHGG